jgi:hypothetical protein
VRHATDRNRHGHPGTRRAAPFLVEGTTVGGTRVFLYHAVDVDPTLARQWLASFVDRHSLIVGDAADKPTPKRATKAKANGAAAAIA